MTYTSNLHLLNVEISANNSFNPAINTAFIPAMFNNMSYLDKYIAGYFAYNIVADSDFVVTSDFLYLKISDTNTILTSNRAFSIASNSIKQLRIIKNETLYPLIFGSITIPSIKTYIIYNDMVISGSGKPNILDIFGFITGMPNVNTILMLKRQYINSILVGGSAKAGTATTSNLTMDIWLNTTKVGSIKFTAGSTAGIVAIFGVIYLNSLDNLYIKTQGIQDSTLSDVGIVLNIIGE